LGEGQEELRVICIEMTEVDSEIAYM